MLEIRGVTKIYRSKAGNEVKALDNVSVTFPDTGMVFVLGKSGSGKSTLLNVIGGLDGCDAGEFIIKGKSSKDFAGSDFDAYRNTFIGFIFQEYNILDDFTVGANIGLALELQGKKATNEKITEILTQVDLTDYAKRKPNELSGGQKQRIAIARALVKDPEIIMADEPTGALDSNTGKQIFDTLKELSKTKLVIIVSHDRDFAERYADRIIEMKDGQIESDVTKHLVEAKSVSNGILQMNDNLLRIEKGYQLTAKDVELINEYLRTRETDVIVSGDKRLNDNVRNVAGISQDNKSSVFNSTDPAKDVKVKQYDSKQTKFIRSSLPMKNAVKMGSSSLGHKKVRLVFTIFLSLIAFALFGFADTLGAYDKVTAATNSIVDTGIKNASFSLGVKYETYSGDKLERIGYERSSLNLKDMEELNSRFGVKFTPIFTGTQNHEAYIDLTNNMQSESYINGQAYTGKLYGFANIADIDPASLGFQVVGTLPAANGEIAISKLMYEQFKANGFKNSYKNETVSAESLTMEPTGASSIIGKHLTMRVGMSEYTFKITAVIDTVFEYDRYQNYIPSTDPSQNTQQGGEEDANALIDMVMLKELANTLKFGYHSLGYVTADSITEMSNGMEIWWSESAYLGEAIWNWNASIKSDSNSDSAVIGGIGKKDIMVEIGGIFDGISHNVSRIGGSEYIPSLNVTWLGERTALGANEMLVSSELIESSLNRGSVNIGQKLEDILRTSSYYDPEESSDLNWLIEQIAYREYAASISTTSTLYLLAKAEYSNWFGDPSPSHESIVRHIADNIPYESSGYQDGDWRYYAKNRYELRGEIIKSIAQQVYGLDLSKYPNIPTDQYSNIFNFNENYENKGDEGWYIGVSFYTLKDIFARLTAYNIIYDPASTVHTTEEFFDALMENNGVDRDDYFDDEKTSDATRRYEAARRYADYLSDYTDRSYGTVKPSDIKALTIPAYFEFSGTSFDQLLSGYYFSTTSWDNNGNEVVKDYKEVKIVGFFERNNMNSNLVVSDTLYNLWQTYKVENKVWYQKYAPHEQGIYSFAIAPMGNDTEFIRKLVEESYNEANGTRFELQNQVMDTLGSFNDFIETGAKVFIYVGLGFALFAALMMMNFISTSISYKRREIGILRAVGARSSDVFKIFFSEALIIALINYVLSIVATLSAIKVLNHFVRQEGLNVTLLNFGIRQIVLMLAISVFVAALSSFLPVWNIARRKPVDAIKNK